MRYFHMAAGFPDHMVVMGGFSQTHEPQHTVMVYNYKCNYWHYIDITGMGSTFGYFILAFLSKHSSITITNACSMCSLVKKLYEI